MATVREGSKGALVVVDMQVGVLERAWNAKEITSNLKSAVDAARASGVPVIWIQQKDDNLPLGSEQWEIVPELVPAEGEPIVSKGYISSFEETELEEILNKAGVSRVILAGAATNWCIRATAYAALERGYDLTLISDAHTTGSAEADGKTIEAHNIIGDLNNVMGRAKYPGRNGNAARAKDIQFDDFSGKQAA